MFQFWLKEWDDNLSLLSDRSVKDGDDQALYTRSDIYLEITECVGSSLEALLAKLCGNQLAGELIEQLPVQIVRKIIQRVGLPTSLQVRILNEVLRLSAAQEPIVIEGISSESWISGTIHKVLRLNAVRTGKQKEECK